jgi:hypothetical protein
MRNKFALPFVLAGFLAVFSGCFTGGSFIANNSTTVELSDANFTLVARDLEGYSKAEYLIGFSFSSGFMANTLALVRIGGTAKLYDEAVRSLWKSYEEKVGKREGKKLALVNIRYDTDILNLFVYTQTELFIHADVIEFTE